MGVFVNSRARFFDANGDPLSGGSVEFFEAGTSTPKTIYTDNGLGTPATNPQVLDADGYVRDGGVWLADGLYKYTVEDSSAVLLYTMDNIGTATAPSQVVTNAVVNDIADLKDLTIGDYQSVYVLGYYEEEDGGGGWFNWDSSDSTTDNGGTVITPTGSPATGRWHRIFENNVVYPMMFGIKPDDTTVTYDSNATAMVTWCKANTNYSHIHFTSGAYHINGTLTFDGALFVEVDDGVSFTETSISGAVTFACMYVEINSLKPLVTTTGMNLFFNPIKRGFKARPEWWGAVGDGATNDALAFQNMITGIGNNDTIELNQKYAIDSTTTFTQLVHFKNDSQVLAALSAVTFDKYTFEASEIPFFSSTGLDQFRFTNQKEFYASHFEIDSSGSIVNTQLDDFLIAVTNNDTQGAHVYWDKDYTFGTQYNDSKYDWVTSEVVNGALMTFDSYSDFGSVANGTEHIFDIAGTNEAVIVNCINVYPQWFGAKSNGANATFQGTNADAIERAIILADLASSGALEGRKAFVDGGGGLFVINKTISLTASTLNNPISMKNISIQGTSGLAGTEMLSFNGHIELDNCSFEALGADDCIKSISLNVGSNDINIKINNCNFRGGANALDSTDSNNVIVTGCDVLSDGGFILDATGSAEFVGNKFSTTSPAESFITTSDACNHVITGNYFYFSTSSGGALVLTNSASVITSITGNTFFNTDLTITDCHNATISGNTYYGALLTVQDVNDTTITGNNFAAQSSLKIERVAGSTVTRLIVTDNYFDITAAANAITLSGVWSSTGHTAQIDGNGTNGTGTLASTVARGTFEVDANADTGVGNLLTVSFSATGEYILPFGTAPLTGNLMIYDLSSNGDGPSILALNTVNSATPATLPTVTVEGLWDGATTVGITADVEYTLEMSNVR